MSGPSPTSVDVNDGMRFRLLGSWSPGTIPKGGIKGFARKTGWDEKAGKGTKGATLTLKSQPPVKGSITIHLIGPGGFYASGAPSNDFANWDAFVANVLSINPAIQSNLGGLTIQHPTFASIGLTQVVVASYSGIEHVGRGLYQVIVELIEFCPPPPKSIVQTPSSLTPDKQISTDAPLSTATQPPRVRVIQHAIAAANRASQP